MAGVGVDRWINQIDKAQLSGPINVGPNAAGFRGSGGNRRELA